MTEENTDGKSATAQAESGSLPAQTATQAEGDRGGRGLEDRIAGYSAENKRLKGQLETLTREREELLERQKTEEQKRLDDAIDKATAPHRAENKKMREFIIKQLDLVNAKLPEERRKEISDDMSFETLSLLYTHATDVLAILSEKNVLPSFEGAANPGEQKPDLAIIPKEEFEKWQQSASKNPTFYKENLERMQKARREGRVR